MQLFVKALEQEVSKLDRNGVRLRVIGDLTPFEPRLRELIRQAEESTASNTRLDLTIAANYGGRWDVTQAINKMLAAQPEKRAAWTLSLIHISSRSKKRLYAACTQHKFTHSPNKGARQNSICLLYTSRCV